MIKKAISFLILLCMLISVFPLGVFAEEDRTFLFNGEPSQFDIEEKDGIYMISSNFAETMGIDKIAYNNGEKTVFSKDNVSVICENMSKTVYINGTAREISGAPYLKNGVLYVPLDTVVKALGFQIKYDDLLNTADIYVASEIEKTVNNAEVIDGMYLSDELLSNTSFEEDFVLKGGWSNRVSSTVMQSADVVHSGKFSGMVTKRPSGWASIGQDVTQIMKEYGTGKYRIRGFVRTKDEPCNMTIKIQVQTTDSKKINSEETEGGVLIVNSDGWTEFDYIADLEWDLSVSLATFYCEATSNTGKTCEVQDYYVDDCSLTKLMSEEEYYAVVENKVKEKDEAEEIENEKNARANEILEKYKDDALDVYYPAESREILKNPYKGLIIYPGRQLFDEESAKWGGGIGSILYHRYSWCYMEPQEGVYNWDILDKNIALCQKYGMQLGLGVGSTVNFNSTTNYNQDTPEWVFEAGCKYILEDRGNGCVLKIPDYDDPIFREKMQNMIDAFSERYNDNETIAYVDMRNYGNWGEWHFYKFPISDKLDKQRTNKEFFAYVDMFKDMRLPALSFVAKPDVTKHALDTFGAGIRGDGLVSPAEMDKHKNMNLVEGKAMAVGEWFEQYATVYQPGGKYAAYFDFVPILFERQIREGHISSIAFLNWDANNAYKLWKDMYDRAANYVGYWYKPVKIEHSKDITKGIFKLKVKNDGVAPLFAGYEKKAVVKLALADKNNKILDTVTLEGLDPLYWNPGEMTDCVGEYEFKNTDGGEKLLFGVFTREQNENPNVKLGINAKVVNGWYDISSMSKSDSANVAHNKLFSAKELYADEGYGFRQPDYACDNDMSTYWANKCANGNYLEIDFGEEKSVSQVSLTSAENIKVKYSIELFRNGKWTEVSNGVSISSKGTNVKFRTAKGEKLRFVIDDDKDAVVKICEMKVW